MRRSGSAAPHSNWSPTVKAPRYSAPIASLRRRPTGIVHRAGHRHRRQLARSLASRVLGTTFTQALSAAIMRFDVGQRHVLLQLDGQRLAVAAHRADAHADAVDRDGRRAEARAAAQDLVGLGAALPLFRLMPLPRSLSIQGIRLPASGTPKLAVSSARQRALLGRRPCGRSPGWRDAGSSQQRRAPRRCSVPNCVSSSRMCCAPPPEAAW